MGKTVIYGAGSTGERIYNLIKKDFSVDYFVDSNTEKIGRTIQNVSIISFESMLDMGVDKIIIGTLSAPNALRKVLIDAGIRPEIIDFSFVEFPIRARKQFVKNFATVVYEKKLKGNVAEAGVFRGEFAREINLCFPNRCLYLFDTFEGFDRKDVELEKTKGYSQAEVGDLNTTSEEIVMNNMEYPDMCVVRKGYFPESAEGIRDSFCFVNLDMDLYKPTLYGLEFFWPQMIEGGIILVHDYYNESYAGVRRAVDEWVADKNIVPFPIGDGISISIQKK